MMLSSLPPLWDAQIMNRQRYHVDDLETKYGAEEDRVADPNGNLVSSRIQNSSMHMPVIDLDLPHALISSSTWGHSHLYLNTPMTWRQYKRVLHALLRAGIIEHGWYKGAVRHKMSFVRAPGVKKNPPPRAFDDPRGPLKQKRKSGY